MKKSFSLVLGIMLFVSLGCSMLCNTQEKIDTTTSGKETASTPADTTKPSTSIDTASLSMDKYEQIKNGMSYAEVSKLLGSEGKVSRRSTVGKIELKSCKWEGDKYRRVYVNFRDDKVNSKSQSGLK
jgi:hypothetical protein